MGKMLHEPIALDVNHMMSDVIGFQYGIDPCQVDGMKDVASAAQRNVEKNRGTGWLGWMQLPYDQEEVVSHIERVAKSVREQFDTFVVLGIGGSALGPIAIQQALNHLHYNELPAEKRGGPRLYVEDNIDPERMAALLDVIDVKKTCFNVITKSGATAETMSQYLIISELLKKEVGEEWAKHIIATTDREKGNLTKLAQENGFELFTSPQAWAAVSASCAPWACCRRRVRHRYPRNARGRGGHGRTLQDATTYGRIPRCWRRCCMYIAMQEMDINVQVVMPYADSLKLHGGLVLSAVGREPGQECNPKGMAVNVGQTPAKALGVTDQHSQLQLYTEGPYDKVITFLKVGQFRTVTEISARLRAVPRCGFPGRKDAQCPHRRRAPRHRVRPLPLRPHEPDHRASGGQCLYHRPAAVLL